VLRFQGVKVPFPKKLFGQLVEEGNSAMQRIAEAIMEEAKQLVKALT